MLEDRLTAPIPDSGNCLLIAVSGAGKTRRLYEELFVKPGIFFTCAKQGNGGSDDLKTCILHSVKVGDSERYFYLLISTRLMICSYLFNRCNFTSSQLLLAQIHPEFVFGGDIFLNLYSLLNSSLKDLPVAMPHGPHDYLKLVAVDEIQASMHPNSSVFVFNTVARTALSPLWKNMIDTFGYGKVAFSGTGMDFLALREQLESSTVKHIPYEVLTDFSPLTEQQVYDYSNTILTQLGNFPTEQGVEIAQILSMDPLFVKGRPRFVAYVLNLLIENISLQDALLQLSDILAKPGHEKFPIKNWELKKRNSVGSDTYHTLILGAVVSYLQGKEAFIEVDSNDLADLVNMGIGYTRKTGRSGIVLTEAAVVQALFSLFIPSEIAQKFISNTRASLNSSTAGFHFEYLVFLKFYFESQADGSVPFKILYGSLSFYLETLSKDMNSDGYIALFPDVFAGKESTFYSSQ